jgi:hypothetical protein
MILQRVEINHYIVNQKTSTRVDLPSNKRALDIVLLDRIGSCDNSCDQSCIKHEIKCHRCHRKTKHCFSRSGIPAVTIVAAWISALKGVGPAIASGNYVNNGI